MRRQKTWKAEALITQHFRLGSTEPSSLFFFVFVPEQSLLTVEHQRCHRSCLSYLAGSERLSVVRVRSPAPALSTLPLIRVQRRASPPPTGQDNVYQRAGWQRQPGSRLLRSGRGGTGRGGAATLLAADAAVVAGRSGPGHGESPRVESALCSLARVGKPLRMVCFVCGNVDERRGG